MLYHTPVLVEETIQFFDPKPGQIYIDATLGNGGHTIEILKTGAKVFGIDQDPLNLKIATTRISEANLDNKFIPIHGNFNDLENIFSKTIQTPPDGILFDLGLSQNQQLSRNRGFSFNDDLSLDMRLDPENQEITAEYIVNTYSFDELYEIFTKYAQEIYSKPLIIRIIKARQKKPVKNSSQLANIIRDYYREKHNQSRIDPSTKIFMALRIAVNNEFSNLKSALTQAVNISKPQTTICVITFHSGEDRIIKQFIKKNFPNAPKPIMPTQKEITKNPLSRSAILRSFRIS
ncbi:MAG: 16S rRNA (cytosine(1402)-N(4))-methyltransferase RsmH [Candidatus Shapirobacteria bacterium]|jgi:16S rRNA (cytosine1402-N4)-methyltransferase